MSQNYKIQKTSLMKKIIYIIISISLFNSAVALEKTKEEKVAKYVLENNISRPDDFVIKSSGKNSSLKLFIIQSIDRKLSLDDIADSKSMDMIDFIKEMESIVYSGTKLDLNYCLEEYLDEDQQEEIYEYFIESESDSIELALEEFDGEFDEFELRLYRINFLSELGN